MEQGAFTLFDKCKAYINSQSLVGETTEMQEKVRPAVTISRQAGAGAATIGRKLANYLQDKCLYSTCPWTLFNRKLIETVLEDHDLPTRLKKFVPEKAINEFEATLNEILGVHPSLWTLTEKIAESMYGLAKQGHVILVGRGGSIITSNLPQVFHIRLVGSYEKRLEHLQETLEISEKEAIDYTKEHDTGRKQYVKKYFDQDIDDPLLYNLVLNTDNLDDNWIVHHLGQMILDWKRR